MTTSNYWRNSSVIEACYMICIRMYILDARISCFKCLFLCGTLPSDSSVVAVLELLFSRLHFVLVGE